MFAHPTFRTITSVKALLALVLVIIFTAGIAPVRTIQAAGRGTVTSTELNVRAGPGKTFDIIDTLRKGDIVNMEGTNAAGDWLRISYNKGGARWGWVSARFVQQKQTLLTLRLHNNTFHEIYYVYISPSTSTDWGPDQLGAYTVESGATYLFTIAPGEYDLMAKNADGEIINSRYNVRLYSNQDWYLSMQ